MSVLLFLLLVGIHYSWETPVIDHHILCPNGLLAKWLEVAGHHDFSYSEIDKYGPDYWQCYYVTCKGKYQSPIDVVHTAAIYYGGWGVQHAGFKKFKGKVRNNGHSVVFTLDENEEGSIMRTYSNLPSSLHFIPFNCNYRLLQFHIHFAGPHGTTGSEHCWDGKHYDAEIHLVHRNMKFETFHEAMDKGNGLAVLGIFVSATSMKLTPFDMMILRNIKNLRRAREEGVDYEFNPATLFPSSKDMIYYRGSLTTPGCHETVNWYLYKTPLIIHKSTLLMLKTFKTKEGAPMSEFGNRRPMQALSGRRILTNFRNW